MALSIPIIFPHMYILGHIPAWRQREFYFLFLSTTTEILWASHRGCHILKKSPENMPMALTCEGMIDRLSFSSLVIPLLWSLPFCAWSSACPYFFSPERLFYLGYSSKTPSHWLWENWEEVTHEVAALAEEGRVHGQSLQTGTVQCSVLPRQEKMCLRS